MNRKTNILLYDDTCPMCTFQTRVLTWLDWGNSIQLMPMSRPEASAVAPTLTREDLREAMHCITPKGKIYRGARAIRFMSFRIPLLFPLGLFLWLPGVIWIAERLYGWVSRNRFVLSRVFGCKEACTILPARQRTSDLQPAKDHQA
jgi:predicted DCC family thiol-disulfide oxidoreductase YuxK